MEKDRVASAANIESVPQLGISAEKREEKDRHKIMIYERNQLNFSKLVVRGFLLVFCFPTLLHRFMVSADEIKLNYMRF